EKLAATAGSKLKTAQVTELLGRASPLEAKYLVKLLAGDLRVGLKEGSVEDALARLAGVKVAAVQWANMLARDIRETPLLSRRARVIERQGPARSGWYAAVSSDQVHARDARRRFEGRGQTDARRVLCRRQV